MNPDPTPVIGLPEEEFIELYNNTDTTIQLQGWTISDGTSTVSFPSLLLPSDHFLIVCANANIPLFEPYGKVVGLPSLPSLNNTSDQLILKDNTGKIIHQLSYDLTWYNDPTKTSGGYTIELKNPTQLCKGKRNFAASADVNGGTPGTANVGWSKIPDTTAPIIVAATAIGKKQVQLVFNEPMDSLSLLNGNVMFTPTNTILSRDVGLVSNDTLRLSLNNLLPENSNTVVSISGVRDCSGNMIVPNSSVSFTYYVPDTAQQYDVLINEMMADPDPGIGLPDAEYIELYNRSDRLISLAGWTLGDAGSYAQLPNYILYPDSFVLITPSINALKFSAIGNVLGVDHFPNLGNDEDVLTLKNERGNIIHHVHYTSNAYRNNVKKNGGWSLELIDVQNPCGGDDNLAASIDNRGGTPGSVNSVKGNKKDNIAPKLLRAYPLNSHVVELRLNEPLDSVSQNSLRNFDINNGLGHPIAIDFYPPEFAKVALVFADSFRLNTIYRMVVANISDCAGNKITDHDYADFGMPKAVDSGDIVINEILFDPRGSGSDFVEIVNRSDKMVDLKSVYIASTNADNSVKEFYPIDTTGLLLFPGSYLVVTDNPSNILSEYPVQQPQQLVACKMPTFANEDGTCVLMNLQEKRFDQFSYSDKMHFALLDTKDGVSLERIDFNRPTNDPSNWTSAASTSGYGTPTGRNSQFASTQITAGLKAEPEVFSPDGDGYNDIVNFSYVLDEAGYAANFYIYNSAGKLEKHLLRNQILGTSGVFSWDGVTDEGVKAAIGIYLCYFEVFNLQGNVIKRKITTVVGGKL